MKSIAETMAAIDLVRFNPSEIIQITYDLLDDVTNGNRQVVDPTNPFMFLLEVSAINAAAAMSSYEALTRKQYGSMALTEEEVYMHMSDKDYLGRFANPSRTTVSILLSRDEVYRRAVDSGVNGMRKITIARHTAFTVAGYTFTMQYPVELRVMEHGGIQVIYDVSRKSPLMSLETNLADYEIVNLDGTAYIRLDVPVLQMKIDVYYPKLTSAALFDNYYNFTSSFHYARVYRALANGDWDEIRTTHTDQVYNPNIPTAVLTVLNGKLRVRIPTVYQLSGAVDTELRIEIYTTDGDVNLILNNYAPEAYTVNWIDLDNDDNGRYIAPLGQFSVMSVFSDSTVSGGTSALSFEELRNRVISNSLGDQQLPITNAQVGSKLENLGYNAVVDLDVVTNRQFLATRTLPKPNDNSIATGMASTISTIQASMESLKNYDTIADNGNRVTITPKTLFRNVNGINLIVHPAEIANLKALYGSDTFVTEITGKNFLYSPFYYVWELKDGQFDCRPYHLDNPEISSKVFVHENATVGLSVSTAYQNIEKIPTGYRLIVKTKSGDVFKTLDTDQIHLQLSVEAKGEGVRAYQNGTLIGRDLETEELLYEFIIQTNHDVDSDNGLIINNFMIYNNVQDCIIDLKTTFTLTYGVSQWRVADMTFSPIDSIVSVNMLPDSHIGVIQEEFNIVIGHTLDALWINNRSVVSSIEYQKYVTDIPAVYEETVYERDPLTGAVIIGIVNDVPTFTVLHAAGEPILSGGAPTFKHFKGETVLDGDGNPIITNPRGMLRQVDMFLVDGLYYFASASAAVQYAKQIPNTVVSWLKDDIYPISRSLLEQSKLFFYPQRTTGTAEALVLNGIAVTVEVEQRLEVNFYVTNDGYKNAGLRLSLSESAVAIIAEALKKSSVKVIDIENKILSSSGVDVLTVSINNLGGEQANYDLLTLTDDSARLGIRKKLVSLADGTYSVEDDVVINFIRHLQS